MFEKQKSAIRKEVGQELRIEQLEDIICPNGQHTWIEMEDRAMDVSGRQRYYTVSVCKKCKKKRLGFTTKVAEEKNVD